MKFVIDNEEMFLEELSPKAMIAYLTQHDVNMTDAEIAVKEHPKNRRYQASCILTALVKSGEEACIKFRDGLDSTGHGYLKKEWDRNDKGTKLFFLLLKCMI